MLLVQFVAYAFSAQCVVICTQNDCGSALADLFIERIPCFFSENTTLGFENNGIRFFRKFQSFIRGADRFQNLLEPLLFAAVNGGLADASRKHYNRQNSQQ